jgi:hypothetical protein
LNESNSTTGREADVAADSSAADPPRYTPHSTIAPGT